MFERSEYPPLTADNQPLIEGDRHGSYAALRMTSVLSIVEVRRFHDRYELLGN